jgi:hypothetical protein
MALLDFEGFDKETVNVSGWFGSFGSVSADGQGWNNYGRHGTSGATPFARSWGSQQTGTVWLQAHIRLTAYGSPTRNIFQLRGVVGNGNAVMAVESNGAVSVNAQGGKTTSVATGFFVLNTWHFVQFRLLPRNSGGLMEVWVDGIQRVSFTGRTLDGGYVDTWFTGDNGVQVDNLVLYNESGDAPNARTPATRVFTDLPTAAGAAAEFTPSAGSNYQCVDEQPNDGDATYVSAAAAPASDLYAYPSDTVPSATIVYGVGVELVARKDDLGGNEINPLLRSDATVYESTPAIALTTSHVRHKRFWNLDPATGQPWTVARANAAQVGVKRSV